MNKSNHSPGRCTAPQGIYQYAYVHMCKLVYVDYTQSVLKIVEFGYYGWKYSNCTIISIKSNLFIIQFKNQNY